MRIALVRLLSALGAAPVLAVALAIVLAIGLAGPAAALDGRSLPGRWYGEKYLDRVHEDMRWITERRANGTFITEVRVYDGCRQTGGYVFSGTWSFDGHIFTSRIRSYSDEIVDRVATYEIVQLSDRSMAYLHRESGMRYTAEKVGADFRFPSCATS
jgi:hypothetical protein